MVWLDVLFSIVEIQVLLFLFFFFLYFFINQFISHKLNIVQKSVPRIKMERNYFFDIDSNTNIIIIFMIIIIIINVV